MCLTLTDTVALMPVGLQTHMQGWGILCERREGGGTEGGEGEGDNEEEEEEKEKKKYKVKHVFS